MTVRQQAFLIWGYYRGRLNYFERNLLKKLLEGIAGLGEITDYEITDYLSNPQIGFIKKLGKRFRLTKGGIEDAIDEKRPSSGIKK